MFWKRLLAGALALVMTGCQLPRQMVQAPAAADKATQGAGAPKADTTLRGQVGLFPSRGDQALPGDVINASTISLIDSNGQTQASAVTDSNGTFTMTLGSYSPSSAPGLYYLEAVHGLGGTLPGNEVGRFRTVLQWNGAGWLSCTNGAVGGTILINQYTTALAIEKALDGTIPLANLIDKVSTANPSALNANPTVTGHSDAEINALAVDLMASLQANLDPIGKVPSVLPSVSAFAPTSAAANAIISVSGSGFSPSTIGNTVTFTGAAQPATILMASTTQLVVIVPSSAQTGPVTVTTRRGTATSSTDFTVTATAATTAGIYVDTYAPTEGRVGTTVTLTGNFGSGTATPDVYFSVASGYPNLPADITSWNATTIVCSVPYGTQSGPVTVKIGKQSVVAPDWFTFWDGELSQFQTMSSSYGYAYTTPWSQYGYANATASVGGKLYYYQIGGYSNDYGQVEVFPVSSDTNNIDRPRMCSRLITGRYYATATVLGDFLYVFGGFDASSNYLGSIEAARILPDGSLGPWSSINTMAVPRRGALVLTRTSTSYMYVLGGHNSGGYLNSWEMWNVTDPLTGAISRTNTGTIYNGGVAVTAGWCVGVLSGTGIFLHLGYNGGWSGVNLSIPINADHTLGAGVAQTSCGYSHGQGQACIVGTDIYVLNGAGGTYNERATFNFANATLSSGWTSVTACPVNIQYTGTPLVTPNNVIWITGGYNSGQQIAVANVESDKTIRYWHWWGQTRRNWYGSIWQTIGRNIWRFGGYDGTGGTYNPITEYYSVDDDGYIGPAITGPTMNYGRHAPFFGRSTGLSTNYMYMVGGYSTSPLYRTDSERVAIDDATGMATGNWQMVPNAQLYRGTYWGASMVIGKYFYCFGGYDAQFTSGSRGIQRATINPDGTLSDFEVLPQQLPWNFYCSPAVRVKDYVYITNGYWNGSISPRVLRARIYPNGDLGNFFWDGTTTDSWGVYGPATTVLGNWLYQFGGYNYYTPDGGYNYYYANWTKRAPINPDGTLGAWGDWQSGKWYPQGGSYISHFATSAPTYKDHVYLMSGYGNSAAILHATFR